MRLCVFPIDNVRKIIKVFFELPRPLGICMDIRIKQSRSFQNGFLNQPREECVNIVREIIALVPQYFHRWQHFVQKCVFPGELDQSAQCRFCRICFWGVLGNVLLKEAFEPTCSQDGSSEFCAKFVVRIKQSEKVRTRYWFTFIHTHNAKAKGRGGLLPRPS